MKTLMTLALAAACTFSLSAQDPTRPPGGPEAFDGPPPFGPGGPGGPGGPMQQELKILKKFDTDGDKRLNATERKAAREYLRTEGANLRRPGPGGRRGGPDGPGFPGGPGGPRFPGGPGGRVEAGKPGPSVSPADVTAFSGVPLYASNVLRTVFLDFESSDWEKELEDFHKTDVEVPASLTVDGRTYPDVGVHFRGMSSYMMIPAGSKRSLNIAVDDVHKQQNVLGYRTLNLLNSHEDASFLRTVLYSEIARHYLPTPAANFVRLVINGESWGVYVSQEQFNKDFVKKWFGTDAGARWKVPGSPGGRGTLAYLGDDPEAYRRIYEIKSKDDPKSWAAIIRLCQVLNETPPDQLEQALKPLLDIDGALKFLALENALINNDGYWARTSDYNLYQDVAGRFHVLPYDMNETFSLPGGPGFGRGPGGPGGFRRPPGGEPANGNAVPRGPGPGFGFGGGPSVEGVKLDPLVAANDASKPLISKLLAVPALRVRYLGYVRDVAEKWLDWGTLGPMAARHQALIADAVKADTRKLTSFEAFERGVTGPAEAAAEERGPHRSISLQQFAEQRRAYLLSQPGVTQRSN